MNIIVVGAGLIGQERIKAINELGHSVIYIVDPVRPEQYNHDAIYPSIWEGNIEHCKDIEDIDWVFVCTPHDETIEIVRWALRNKCNVLAEKPLGRTLAEYNSIFTYVPNKGKVCKVGFNYRFFKGVRQLLIDCQNKLFGDLISVNMVLSYGGSPGSEGTWKFDPYKAGCGAILDPGIHLIDLAMLISEGSLTPCSHYQWEAFWKRFWKTGIMEECHVLATDSNHAIYNIQASVCHWRNTFRIEVNGTEGYGIIEGRNRHYGNQTYRRGKRWGWQSGKPQRESEELVIDYDGNDSFLEETRAVLCGCEGIQPADYTDNYHCLKFIENAV